MKLLLFILLIKWLSITIEAQKRCLNPIVILDKTIPQIIYLEKIGFGTGFTGYNKKIIIVGIPTNQTDQFAINLAEEGELFKTANVPFHFNPRFDYDKGVVVANSWIKPNGWGTEQTSGGFPFEIGKQFVLEIMPISPKRPPGVNLFVNDKSFVFYPTPNRYSLKSISQIEINGAIQLSSITLCGGPKLPPLKTCEQPIIFSNVNVPVNYDFEKIGLGTGFLPKKMITIIGTHISDEYGPKDFVINIGESGVMEKNASILFSFNPRFDEKVVVRNSWTKEKGWGIEQRWGGFPFASNQSVVVEIYAKYNNSIYVDVNYKFFTTFSRHDLDKVSQIEISRAIKVSSVVFCKKYN